MKSSIIRMLIAFLLLACSSGPVVADGGDPVPLCYPKPCN